MLPSPLDSLTFVCALVAECTATPSNFWESRDPEILAIRPDRDRLFSIISSAFYFPNLAIRNLRFMAVGPSQRGDPDPCETRTPKLRRLAAPTGVTVNSFTSRRCQSHVPDSGLHTPASGTHRTIASRKSCGLTAETYGALFLRCASARRAESAAGPAVDVWRLRLTAKPFLTRPKMVRRF